MATPSPDELADIEDIKDIYREPARWTDYLPWIAIIGFLVLLALLAGWWYRRRKNRPAVVAQRVIEQPAHILALRKLQLLKRPDGQHPTQVKTYYADLTYIFREYLEKRYGFPALESVSAEIVTALAATSFPKSLLPALTALLEEADQVKFAKGLPADSYHAKAWALVKEAVEATAETARVQPTKA
jgi:LPXTG-motif cell wall-anchored protein